MARRRTPIIPGEIYHVFNRSIARQPIFKTKADYNRALDVLSYYRFYKPSLRFSHYNRLQIKQRHNFLDRLLAGDKKMVLLLAYCIMPNHVHFLIKEMIPGGIRGFMSNFQNSYAKYFNTKNQRSGALFQEMFKAVRIESDEQLLHVCRYIHLNPFSSYVIAKLEDLDNYDWSSYSEYLKKTERNIVETSIILEYFKSIQVFEEFTLNQAEYQRTLDYIKHLILE